MDFQGIHEIDNVFQGLASLDQIETLCQRDISKLWVAVLDRLCPKVAPAVLREYRAESSFEMKDGNADILCLSYGPTPSGGREMHMETTALVTVDVAEASDNLERTDDLGAPRASLVER